MGAIFLEIILRSSCLEGLIGMSEAGSERFGKYEIRGVPGGGRIKENSAAREERGVDLVDSGKIKLVLDLSNARSDCGVMSFAKPAKE